MKKVILVVLGLLIFTACNEKEKTDEIVMGEDEMLESPTGEASVIAVSTIQNDAGVSFTVSLRSPDTGCGQYADWWEVITEDGELLNRRILAHSHVNEQPFARSGSAFPLEESLTVIIRGHMNNSGYGTTVFKGSINAGFDKTTIDKDFAKELANQQPLPSNCAF